VPTGQFGDLVIEMGIDDRNWIEAVLRIQGSAKGMAATVQTEATKASGALGRSIAQLGFAGQDFASVLEGGGKNALSRALMSTMNNVQMLGAALGPWGMALTAVGGTIGSLLIPKLLEGTSAEDKFTESIKTNVTAFDAQIRKMNEAVDFRDKLETLGGGTSTALDAAIHSEDIAKAKATGNRDALGLAVSDAMKAAVAAGAVTNLDPAGRGMFVGRDARLSPDAKFNINEDILGKEWTKELRDLYNRWRGTATTLTEIDARKTALEGIRPKTQENRELEENIRLQKEAERIRESTRTPLEAARDRLSNIAEAAMSGFLDPDSADKAANNALRDFAKSKGSATSLAVGGGDYGSASGFSDVLKSIRQSQGASSPELDALKGNKDSLDKILATLRAGLKLSPAIVQEGI
jgi:hypothetical protein